MNYFKGALALIAITVIGYLAGTITKRDTPPELVVISHGEADVGGPFELIDANGNVFTDQDLLGKVSIVYFGYTHCPDVCPLDMNRISIALGILEAEVDLNDNLNSVFITVDPLRDPPEEVAEFLTGYHPSFIGLTGTQEQMEVAAKAYRVYWEEMLEGENEASAFPTIKANPEMLSNISMVKTHNPADPVLIDHSANIYLMDENGKYITHFDSSITASRLAEEIKKHLD